MIRKVECVYDSKFTALEMNTNRSKGIANKNKEIRHDNTMRKTPNTRPPKESPS